MTTRCSPTSNCSWGGTWVGDDIPSTAAERLGDASTSKNSDRRWTAHPQPHEQLFMGWITGGVTTAVPNGAHDEGHGTHVYEEPLVGWVLLERQVRGDEVDEMAPQHPPPTTVSPRSQGGLGANCPVTTSTTMSTHSHAYEPLLVGWIVSADENDTGV